MAIENLEYNHPLATPSAAPWDPEVTDYVGMTGMTDYVNPKEYSGWLSENMSWKETCYLHVFLSGGMAKQIVKGPDAEKVMSRMCVNSFTLDKFKVGRGKHVIACADNGNIIQHGVCIREAEDQFDCYNLDPLVGLYCNSGEYDVEPMECDYNSDFVFQFAGPKSLEIVENIIKQDVHDLSFMGTCKAEVLGIPVRVIRMGMGGTLSYEIHGDMKDAETVYFEALRIGEPYGLKKLGWYTYMCNHTENGFVQNGEHFISDWTDPMITGASDAGEIAQDFPNLSCELRGSLCEEGREAYYLNIFEAGWGGSINWDHDFKGKDALLALKESDDYRRVCTLEWNREDILKVMDSFLDDEPGVSHYMEFPQNLKDNGYGSTANMQDKVVDAEGKMIGKSTGRVYTRYYKKVISLGFIDPEFAEEGTEVTIVWGMPGERQIPVRAKVARFPYLDLVDNRNYDIESIPHYQA